MKKLFYGGDIITMVREEDAPEAVLVEDGQITYVGTLAGARAACEAAQETGRASKEPVQETGRASKEPVQETGRVSNEPVREIDLGGRTLMPSFIDGHSHISAYSQLSAFPDVSECGSFDEIVEFLKTYLAEHRLTADDVLLATGYDHNFLREEAHPTRDVLDRISREVPVYLYHSSGHMGVINTALMRQAGLSPEADDPQGGRYGRYADGTLNGYLEEQAAFAPVLEQVFARLQPDPAAQMKAVQDVYLKYGVTTAQEGAASRQTVEGLAAMAENGVLKIDVVPYIMASEKPETVMESYPQYTGRYRGHLKIGGGKTFLDGSPQGKSAWLTEPYEGETDYRGYGSCTDEQVTETAVSAIRNGYQLLAHANGDAASEQFIRCYKKALEITGVRNSDLRPVMIHCQTVRDDQLKEMAKIGMLPSIFVAHTYFWGDVHLKNLGKRRAMRISPVKSALNCGLKYNFHQDCPVLPPDMMRTVWCAVNRVTRKGVLLGAEQKVSVFEALKGVTINAAFAYHEENEKGTLEAGKLADMVILDKNPLKTAMEELKDIRVLETIKEGGTLYRRPV